MDKYLVLTGDVYNPDYSQYSMEELKKPYSDYDILKDSCIEYWEQADDNLPLSEYLEEKFSDIYSQNPRFTEQMSEDGQYEIGEKIDEIINKGEFNLVKIISSDFDYNDNCQFRTYEVETDIDIDKIIEDYVNECLEKTKSDNEYDR